MCGDGPLFSSYFQFSYIFNGLISCSTRGVCIDTQVIAWTRDAVSQVMILDRKVSALAFGIPWGLADFQKACGDFAIILM